MSPIEFILMSGGVAAALVAIGTAFYKSGKAILSVVRRLLQFLEDWGGEPARPGQPERPGVMKRLERIEAQVHPNHGSSLADQLDRVEKQVLRAVTKEELAALKEQIEREKREEHNRLWAELRRIEEEQHRSTA